MHNMSISNFSTVRAHDYPWFPFRLMCEGCSFQCVVCSIIGKKTTSAFAGSYSWRLHSKADWPLLRPTYCLSCKCSKQCLPSYASLVGREMYSHCHVASILNLLKSATAASLEMVQTTHYNSNYQVGALQLQKNRSLMLSHIIRQSIFGSLWKPNTYIIEVKSSQWSHQKAVVEQSFFSGWTSVTIIAHSQVPLKGLV